MTNPGNALSSYIPPGPIAQGFLNSDAFVRGLRGPIGSGKSTACVMEILKRAKAQRPSTRDGKRKSRWAVIRNTYPELKTTTINTWHQWVPKGVGHWVEQGPPTHHLIDKDHDVEVLFLALDSDADIKKLLSLELTGAWINEAREVPKSVLDALTGRVGRYPAVVEGGCTWSGVIMDTNSPEEDSWWAKLADFPDEQQLRNTLEAERRLREIGARAESQPPYEFFAQPGGLHPRAENLPNLPAGYYVKAMAGKKDDWIKVYVHNNYGFVVDGKPVINGYLDNLHCKPVTLNPNLGLWIGIDFGLTPAAVFGQRSLMGQWRILSELVTEDMGAARFAQLLKQHVKENYQGIKINGIVGDPAGDQRAQTDENTPFKILKANDVEAVPAKTNDFTLRCEAWERPLSRLIDGEPGLVVDPGCKMLRKGLSGGYKYRKLKVAGAERFTEVPEKNKYSHPCEAGGYMLIGGGEHKEVVKRDPATRGARQAQADTDYSIFG